MKELLIEKLLEKKQTKQELSELFNVDERTIRKIIAEISMEYPVISHSKVKGYRISNVDELLKENDFNHVNSEIEELEHCINEIESRIKELSKRKVALLKAIEQLKKGM